MGTGYVGRARTRRLIAHAKFLKGLCALSCCPNTRQPGLTKCVECKQQQTAAYIKRKEKATLIQEHLLIANIRSVAL